MRSSSAKVSARKRRSSASVAFACSLLVALPLHAAQPSKSLFGFELQLDDARVFTTAEGKYVGWPEAEAEALLDVFENRIPLMKQAIEQSEETSSLKDEQIKDLRAAVRTATAALGAQKELTAEWKQTAEDLKPTLLERIFLGPEFWLFLGLAAGIGVAKLVWEIK